jgi:hypothetical protein
MSAQNELKNQFYFSSFFGSRFGVSFVPMFGAMVFMLFFLYHHFGIDYITAVGIDYFGMLYITNSEEVTAILVYCTLVVASMLARLGISMNSCVRDCIHGRNYGQPRAVASSVSGKGTGP